MSQITNLSANNSAGAIKRYRDNYDQTFSKPPSRMCTSPDGGPSIVVRCPMCGGSHDVGYLSDVGVSGMPVVGYECRGVMYRCEWVKYEGDK